MSNLALQDLVLVSGTVGYNSWDQIKKYEGRLLLSIFYM